MSSSAYVPADDLANAQGISEHTVLYGGRKASLQLHVLIVGCGLGGLAAAHSLAQAGHRVTLVEAAHAIGDVGAGIQVTPNVSRLLIRWGLAQQLRDIAVTPEAIVFRRYSTGERVGYTKWGDRMLHNHGSPYYNIHRADFHRMLFDLAAPFIDLRLKSTVVAVDPGPEKPSLTLASGEVIYGDLIVGADGVKSLVQKVVLGRENPAEPTGDAAYRAIIPTSVMLSDPDLKPFVDLPEMTAWMGPGRHMMAYNIRAKREFNVVLLHPDDGSVESWSAEGSADKMRADFADFEPRVQKLLSHVKSTLKWRLMGRQPLETWVHPAGRVVLLGDSCHPMLPYRAQGAAMAIEDAAVLGSLFSRLSHPSQIASLLKAYEHLRLPRTAETQASSRLNQYIFHLPDGEAQRVRDQDMKQAMEVEFQVLKAEGDTAGVRFEDVVVCKQEMVEAGNGRVDIFGENFDGEGNQNQWADKRKNAEQFGYDADEAAERWWAEVGVREIEPLGHAKGTSTNGESGEEVSARL